MRRRFARIRRVPAGSQRRRSTRDGSPVADAARPKLEGAPRSGSCSPSGGRSSAARRVPTWRDRTCPTRSRPATGSRRAVTASCSASGTRTTTDRRRSHARTSPRSGRSATATTRVAVLVPLDQGPRPRLLARARPGDREDGRRDRRDRAPRLARDRYGRPDDRARGRGEGRERPGRDHDPRPLAAQPRGRGPRRRPRPQGARREGRVVRPRGPRPRPARGLPGGRRPAGRALPARFGRHARRRARARAVERLAAAGTPHDIELLVGLPFAPAVAVAQAAQLPARVYVPHGHASLRYGLAYLGRNPRRIWWLARDLLLRRRRARRRRSRRRRAHLSEGRSRPARGSPCAASRPGRPRERLP